MAAVTESLSKPDKSASFDSYLSYYRQRLNVSENKLAACARMSQSKLNKITNRKTKDVKLEDLVCLCLALGLNEEESYDLMSRKDRVLNLTNPRHVVFLELIRIYSKKQINNKKHWTKLLFELDEADKYLKERGFELLPNRREKK